MRDFINELTERNFQNKLIGIIENGSWMPMAEKVIKGMFEKSKNLTYTNTTVKILSAPSDESRAQIESLANELI
jgi:flavorubredoxin